MKRIIDIKTWKRREHFEFFDKCEEAFFGIVSHLDISNAYRRIKGEGGSIYLDYLHKAMRAVNEIEEFRTRIEGEEIVDYNTIHVSATVYKDNDTFGFSFIPFVEKYDEFAQQAREIIKEARLRPGIGYTEDDMRLDTIHCTTIPWFSFTGLSHPRYLAGRDSVPKISFGKFENKEGKLLLPLSIHAHHGLMDGSHVGQYLDKFQDFLNE